MGSVTWEDPPGVEGTRLGGRGKSKLRVEADEMLEELRENPGRWARLADFETKEEARKRQGFLQKKGWGFAVRDTGSSWALFGRFKAENAAEAEVRKPTF
jgi:hypothetical protein